MAAVQELAAAIQWLDGWGGHLDKAMLEISATISAATARRAHASV